MLPRMCVRVRVCASVNVCWSNRSCPAAHSLVFAAGKAVINNLLQRQLNSKRGRIGCSIGYNQPHAL